MKVYVFAKLVERRYDKGINSYVQYSIYSKPSLLDRIFGRVVVLNDPMRYGIAPIDPCIDMVEKAVREKLIPKLRYEYGGEVIPEKFFYLLGELADRYGYVHVVMDEKLRAFLSITSVFTPLLGGRLADS